MEILHFIVFNIMFVTPNQCEGEKIFLDKLSLLFIKEIGFVVSLASAKVTASRNFTAWRAFHRTLLPIKQSTDAAMRQRKVKRPYYGRSIGIKKLTFDFMKTLSRFKLMAEEKDLTSCNKGDSASDVFPYTEIESSKRQSLELSCQIQNYRFAPKNLPSYRCLQVGFVCLWFVVFSLSWLQLFLSSQQLKSKNIVIAFSFRIVFREPFIVLAKGPRDRLWPPFLGLFLLRESSGSVCILQSRL